MGDLLVGIDVGTASSKGVLLRPDGSPVAETRVAHGIEVPRPGWAEQDADAVWWADVAVIARMLTDTVPAGDRVVGVAASAIGPTLLPLDEAGRPLRAGILYGVDTRATAQIADLEARHGAASLEAHSGMVLSSQAIGPKIAWLVDEEPEVAARARWYVTASTYLTYRLTGRLVIDAHTASHWNPLFDPSTLGWSERFAAGLTPLDRLAPIGWPADLAGAVTPEAAAVTGIPVGTPVAVGTVDALAEALSVGVVQPGDLMVMYGSTTFLILVTEARRAATPLWSTPGIEPGSWALAAGLATGGSALSWFRDRLAPDLVAAQAGGGLDAFAALGAEAEAASGAEPASGAEAVPLVLPYLSGERTPINDPRARGVVAGLSLHTTRGGLYRGLVEGIALAVRSNVEAMRALGAPIDRVLAVGGGVADASLVQAVSDAIGLDQALPASTVGASRGDAFLAGVVAGRLALEQIGDWVDIRENVRPDPVRAAALDDRYAAFRGLYEETRPTVHALVDGAAR